MRNESDRLDKNGPAPKQTTTKEGTWIKQKNQEQVKNQKKTTKNESNTHCELEVDKVKVSDQRAIDARRKREQKDQHNTRMERGRMQHWTRQ